MRNTLLAFAAGLVIGALIIFFGLPVLRSSLPAFLGGPGDSSAVVVEKRLEPERLLLTFRTEPSGEAVLATFTKQLEEIDLLVSVGDRVSVRLPKNKPFADNPDIGQVIKLEGSEMAGSGELPEAVEPPPPALEEPMESEGLEDLGTETEEPQETPPLEGSADPDGEETSEPPEGF